MGQAACLGPHKWMPGQAVTAAAMHAARLGLLRARACWPRHGTISTPTHSASIARVYFSLTRSGRILLRACPSFSWKIDAVLPDGPGKGYHIRWYGVWMEHVHGVSFENYLNKGLPFKLRPQEVLPMMHEQLNRTQVVHAAIFDLLTSQCDRHAQVRIHPCKHGRAAEVCPERVWLCRALGSYGCPDVRTPPACSKHQARTMQLASGFLHALSSGWILCKGAVSCVMLLCLLRLLHVPFPPPVYPMGVLGAVECPSLHAASTRLQ